MENKVILVTGGSGLIGQGIQAVINTDKRQDEEWIFLSSKDANLLNQEETFAVFEKHKPTLVVHLASFGGGLYVDTFKNNLKIDVNVLDASHRMKVKRLLSCLNTCIFPIESSHPIMDETMIHNGPPHPSNFCYSYAKRTLDLLTQVQNYEHNCNFTSVIPCNVFGPHGNINIGISGIIKNAYEAKQNGTDLEVLDADGCMKQFIYSPDLAKLFIWAVREYEEADPIIFAPDEADEVSIKEVALMILEAFDFVGEVKFLTNEPDGQLKRTASNAKMRKYLPQFKFTPIRQAIEETVDWFVDKNHIE